MAIQKIKIRLGCFENIGKLIGTLKKNRVRIEPDGHMLLTNFDFTLSEEEREVEVAIGSLSDFGINEALRVPDCYRALCEKGYELCPPEIGPLLAITKEGACRSRLFSVAMSPLLMPTEVEAVFFIKNTEVYGELRSIEADQETYFAPGMEIVVLCPP